MTPQNKLRVLVAMSGGVDSSVVAALLGASKKYEVMGAYMLNYDNNQPGSESCWLPDYRDALRAAAHLGIQLLKFDFTKEYKKMVLDYMFKEYQAGRTPNSDVLCNTFIKFGAWLEKAQELGFDYLATGHYARIGKSPLGRGRPARNALASEAGGGGLALLTSKDTNKDQTYFLHQLNQNQLAHTLFPIGGYTKPEVRKLALKFGLPTAKKEESMGICFVGEVPMKEFLEKKIKHKPGKIILSTGEVVGTHEGLSFYTIGQRHGLSFGGRTAVILSETKDPLNSKARDSSASPQNDSKPLYVVDKHPKTNELVVGYENDPLLYKKEVALGDIHWVGQIPKLPLKCLVRLRHRQSLQKAIVSNSPLGRGRPARNALASEAGGGGLAIKFATPERAVTPGQFAVFYLKGECLGGGVII